MRFKYCLIASVIALLQGTAWAQTTVKLGVLTDLSGPYADMSGKGSLIATELAVEDFKKLQPAVKVEVVLADHQNKPDIGSAIVRKWIDQDGVDAIVDVASSPVSLAVSPIIKAANKVFLATGSAVSDLTGKACSPNTIHWTYDTYALAKSTSAALTKSGGDKWFFIAVDVAFGHAMQRDATRFVEAAGGKVLGGVRAPLNTADFSSFLVQAQGSGANVIALANAGADTINTIKQAGEFGLTKRGARLAPLVAFITDIRALGLNVAQGVVITEAF